MNISFLIRTDIGLSRSLVCASHHCATSFPGISPTSMVAPSSGFDLLRHFSPRVPQWYQSPCWMTDLKYSYLVLNNQTSQPPSKKNQSTDERNNTSSKSHLCALHHTRRCHRSDELCLCCAPPDRGEYFQALSPGTG